MMGMGGQNDVIAKGIYTPESDTNSFVIDTGKSGWTHFLIVVKTLPYAEDVGKARAMTCRYYNAETNTWFSTFGSSTSSKPDKASIISEPTISGNTISWSGSNTTAGLLIKDVEYEWFCWK